MTVKDALLRFAPVLVVALLMSGVSFAGSTVFPPSLNLEIAGHTMWVSPKGDVWSRLDSSQQRFVESYAAAVYSKNAGQFKNLILPASLKCLEEAPKDFLDTQMNALTGVDMVQGEYTLAFEPIVQKFDAAFDKAQKTWFKDPVENTHTFAFGYVSRTGATGVMTHKLYRSGDRYFIVLGCPTQKNIKRMEQSKIDEEEYKEGVRKALAALNQNELDTLNDFLSQFAFKTAVEEYKHMHPEFEIYAFDVVRFLGTKVEEKRSKESANPVSSAKRGGVVKTETEKLASNVQPKELEPLQNDTFGDKPINWMQIGIILTLILASGVLLLRVVRTKK